MRWKSHYTTQTEALRDIVFGMLVRELAVRDAFEFTPDVFADRRGLFVAPFQEDTFVATVGHRLNVAQTNHSVSAPGTIRGVHFSDTPPGQAKYVYCPSGELLDVIVDVRVGSPTFGHWDAVRLDAAEYRAVYLAEGLGHAFLALAENTVLAYLCSTGYNPAAEHGINPYDAELGLPWPTGTEPIMSEKDSTAPTLRAAHERGLLPDYEACRSHYDRLRGNQG